MKRFMIWCLAGGLVLALFGGAVLGGYFIRDQQVTPLANLIPRVERKLKQMSGAPNELEQKVALIETTFVQLRGTVMRPPNINWVNGGALSVRDDDLIIMDRLARFYITDGETPITRLRGLSGAPNGLAEYEAFAASPEGQAYTHKINLLRFNDVQWVEGTRTGLVLSYTFFNEADLCYGTRLAFAPVAPEADLRDIRITSTDWEVIYETAPCLALNVGRAAIEGHMAGGRLAYDGADTIYLGSGDYHLDGIHARDAGIQDDATDYGKVMAIDLASGDHRMVSKGHRNMQGVAMDREGRLWVTEHGVRGGDELNLVREGANYGWPETTLGTLYSGQPVPNATYGRHDVGQPPAYAWLPSAAVSSLTALDNIDPAWDGDLLAGSLSSEGFGQSLWRIRPEGDRVLFVERIRLGERIRYVTQFGPRIAVWLDSNDLILFDVTRRPDALAAIKGHIDRLVSADLAEDVLRVFETCSECHSYQQNEHLAGPSLNGIVGRRVAGTGFTGYSDALRKLSGRWDAEQLTAYLTDPDAVARGTSMPASGLREGPVLEAVIEVLSQVDDNAAEDLTYN